MGRDTSNLRITLLDRGPNILGAQGFGETEHGTTQEITFVVGLSMSAGRQGIANPGVAQCIVGAG